MRSFRLKLALIMTLVPGAIVLGFGAAAWWILYEHMLDAVDARMSLPANAFARRVSPRMNPEDFQRLTASFIGEDRSKSDRLEWVVVIRNDSAEIISESQPGLATAISLKDYLPLPGDFEEKPPFLDEKGGGPRPPPHRRPPPPRRPRLEGRPPPGPPPRTHLQRKPIHFTSNSDTSRWRVGAYSSPFATVFVGVDLAPFDADVQRTRSIFLWAVLGGIGLSALAGCWIANKAMRPIRRITETAEHITAHALDERIQTTGREDKEFARLVNVLNAMMERLERSFHHAVRFSADASHELKTPLAVMRGELERGLKECEANSLGEQTFLNLNEEVHRLNRITEALLMLSRADAGSLSLDKRRFSIGEALVSFSEDAEILCAEKGLSFQCKIEQDLNIYADRALMLGVLHNLLSNAIKYNEAGGAVEIVTRCQGQFAAIEVANTGPGIPDNQRNRVFRRFFRGDDARSRKKDGFGLGLNIALELTHANGGSLRLLDPQADGKTRFAICLPFPTPDQKDPIA